MWSIKCEEKLIFEVANTKEVGSLFTTATFMLWCCRVTNIQIRNFAQKMPLCRVIYCGLQLIPTQYTLRAPQEDFAQRSCCAENSHISLQNTTYYITLLFSKQKQAKELHNNWKKVSVLTRIFKSGILVTCTQQITVFRTMYLLHLFCIKNFLHKKFNYTGNQCTEEIVNPGQPLIIYRHMDGICTEGKLSQLTLFPQITLK